MCRPNKALHLSGFIKTKHVVLGLIGEQISFLRKRRGEKGENIGFARRSGLGWLCFSFLAPKRPNNIQEEI